jgi:hypothetical protein
VPPRCRGPRPTDPYTGSTIAICTTTTTRFTSPYHLTLIISYAATADGGIVSWQACGFPASAVGTLVQLYFGGTIQTEAGGSGPILAGGCTSEPQFPVCDPTGTYTAQGVDAQADLTATDSPEGTPAEVVIAASTCASAASAAGAGSSGTSSNNSTLAFTGTNIIILIVIAGLLIAVGYTIVRLNRQRRRAS